MTGLAANFETPMPSPTAPGARHEDHEHTMVGTSRRRRAVFPSGAPGAGLLPTRAASSRSRRWMRVMAWCELRELEQRTSRHRRD